MRITKSLISINLIGSERWSLVHLLRTFTTLTTERCQVMSDSVTPLSLELTHGPSLWLKRKLSMKLELRQRDLLKSLRLRASQDFNLTLKSLSMSLVPTATMIKHQLLNLLKLLKRAHMSQEKLLMPMETALKIMLRKLKLSSIDSESQFLVKLATIFITLSMVIFRDTSDTEKILSQQKLIQLETLH